MCHTISLCICTTDKNADITRVEEYLIDYIQNGHSDTLLSVNLYKLANLDRSMDTITTNGR